MSFDLLLIDGDLKIKEGDFQIVENSDKLVQDVLKLVSTQLGTNPFFPAYGSPMSQALIGTAYEEEFVQNVASQQLRSSIERLQLAQLEQLKKRQIVTPDEQIAAIADVSVAQSVADPRFYIVKLTVISKAFQRIPIEFAVSSS